MDVLSLSEAAEQVKVSMQTLRNYIREGKLTEYRRGKRFMVDRTELLTLFAPVRVTPRKPSEQLRVIAVCNQKGGVGKTTTVSALGYLLAQQYPTLVIDADPQGNLTQSFGIDPDKLNKTLYEVMVEGLPLEAAIQKVPPPPAALSLIGSNLDLAATSRQVSGRLGWESLLQDALQPLLGSYQYVLIDCPPNLDTLTINALTAATEVIVPVDMGVYSLRGTAKLLDLIQDVRKVNPRLGIPRFLACRSEATKLSETIIAEMTRAYSSHVFHTVIRKGVAVGEAQLAHRPLLVVSPNSHPARDYTALAKEVVNG